MEKEIFADEGILLQSNRSIRAEGVFDTSKDRYYF